MSDSQQQTRGDAAQRKIKSELHNNTLAMHRC